MSTTTTAILESRLSQQIDDYLEVICTTAIDTATATTILSTNLNAYDGGADDAFNDWWCYITDKANAAVNTQVSNYATSGGTLTVRATLADDGANLATIRLHRYNRNYYIRAINDTSREISDKLFAYFNVRHYATTGNLLPNSFFRDWTSSSYPDKYGVTNATAAKSTTVAYTRGYAQAALVTTTSTNGYMSINSDDYPRLLDIMGQTVTLRCWANPLAANDAFVEIYTINAAGTTQTLTSTTACPAGKYTLLELSQQAINDDITYVSIRFKIATTKSTSYFANARLTGVQCHEYWLSPDLYDVDSYSIQAGGLADYPCDDLYPEFGQQIAPTIISDGTDRFLQIPYYADNYLIRLMGTKPLSEVTAYTDTIEIGDPQLAMFLAYAKYKLFQMIKTPVGTQNVDRYNSEVGQALWEYQQLLPRLGMSKNPRPLRFA